ncbi:MAG: hypothetical protein WD432_02035 [Candidatus Saccharimonadales bacterium]
MAVVNNKNLPSARRILSMGFKKWRANIKPLLYIGLIWLAVETTLSFLGEISLLASQIWFVLMFTILIWLFSRSGSSRNQDQPTLSQLFYTGSANFFKQALVLIVFIIYLIPFTLGAGLAQFINLYQFSPSPVELSLARTAWLVFSVISGYWLLRAWVAPLYISTLTPLKAIKRSWQVSKGKMPWVFRCVGLGFLVATLPLVFIQALFLLPLQSEWWFFTINTVANFITYIYSLPLLISTAYKIKNYAQ